MKESYSLFHPHYCQVTQSPSGLKLRMLLQPLLPRVSYLCLLCWKMHFPCLGAPLFGPCGKGAEQKHSERLCFPLALGQGRQEAVMPFSYSLPATWVIWLKALWTILQELETRHPTFLLSIIMRSWMPIFREIWPSCPPLASLQEIENLLLCRPSSPAHLLLLKPPLSPICIWPAIYFVAHFLVIF